MTIEVLGSKVRVLRAFAIAMMPFLAIAASGAAYGAEGSFDVFSGSTLFHNGRQLYFSQRYVPSDDLWRRNHKRPNLLKKEKIDLRSTVGFNYAMRNSLEGGH
ncbi:hypothetical protein JYT83_00510 [bacterium AH-315-F18]|nr:hypothetical protein [bacterium AH-315-F18]